MIATRILSRFMLIAAAPKLFRVFAIGFIVLTIAGSRQGSAQDAAPQTEPENWLLVIQGTVLEVGDGTMSLDVPDIAVYFTDRPHRVVKPVVLSTYLQAAWANDAEMRQVPPNASLIDENANTIAVIEIFTLEIRDDGHLHAAFSLLDGNAPVVGDVIALTIDDDDSNCPAEDRNPAGDCVTVNPMITD
jgi:hypothetical protein